MSCRQWMNCPTFQFVSCRDFSRIGVEALSQLADTLTKTVQNYIWRDDQRITHGNDFAIEPTSDLSKEVLEKMIGVNGSYPEDIAGKEEKMSVPQLEQSLMRRYLAKGESFFIEIGQLVETSMGVSSSFPLDDNRTGGCERTETVR